MFKFAFDQPSTSAQPTTNDDLPQPPRQITYVAQSPLDTQQHDAVTFSNDAVLLRKSTATAPSHLTPHGADIVPRVYEGGFKLWECAGDLVQYLHETQTSRLPNRAVLELGAGHALPAIVAARLRAAAVDVQDYNEEVIRSVTMPNVAANVDDKSVHNFRFFAGSWRGLPAVLKRQYDVILSSDTVYATEQNAALAECILTSLAPDGVAFVAGKTYYFGVGGGMRSFESQLAQQAARIGVELRMQTVREIRDGVSNVREILQIQRV